MLASPLRPRITPSWAWILLSAAVLLACTRSDQREDGAAPEDAGAAAGALPHAGVTVELLTFTGPQIVEPIARRAAEIAARTGAQIRITRVPFRDLYRTALDDLRDQGQKYHVIVFPAQWLADFAAPGFLEDLSPRVAADQALAWDDIAAFFRDTSATYAGRSYSIPLDGDFQLVYYRTDVLEEAGLAPPRTWDDYLRIARTVHGRDLDGDRVPDYGSCISRRLGTEAYWTMWSIAGAYLQSKGTAQGAFFHTETMEPLVTNPGFARALDIYRATSEHGPPEEREPGFTEMRELFISGRCALTIDWGDIGTLAIAPGSRVEDQIGAVLVPGSREVLDRATGKLVPCDKITCPYAIDGVNHAPYAATGGWAGAISAAAPPRVKDAAFAFLSYMSQPAQSGHDVTIGATGFNPYRKSHFSDHRAWLQAGMSEQAAAHYLGAIGMSLSSRNMVLDLRIPHNQRYQQEVLEQALSAFLRGERTRDQVMQDIAAGWNRITDELGRDAQRHAYRASLGASR